MRKLILSVAMAVATVVALADQKKDEPELWMPVGLSLLSHPMQIPSSAHSVVGVMLNAGYGKMDNVYFVEAGLFNNVTGKMGGLQAGVSNLAGCLVGVQAGLVNIADDAYGFQFGLVNVADRLHGLQVGLVNVNKAGTVFFPVLNLAF